MSEAPASPSLPRAKKRRACGWEIRQPTEQDASGLIDLKIEWSAVGRTLAAAERAEFAQQLTEWIARLGDSLVCRIAVTEDGQVIGMAWLVLFERVPNVGQPRRLSGDLQSVYVVPAFRGQRVGRALVASLCAEADARGIPRVTVHSNPRATALYEHAGFALDGNLLVRSSSEQDARSGRTQT